MPVSSLAQVPRISPPPPCRIPAGFREPLLNVRLPATRLPSLVVFPFTQGVVERRYAHVPWALAERVRNQLRAQPGLAVASAGITHRVTFETGGSVDSARSVIGARWMLAGDVEPAGTDTRVRVRLLQRWQDSASWTGDYLLSRRSLTEIEHDVTAAVARVLSVRYVEPTPRLALPRATVDHALGAADLLLQDHSPASTDSATRLLEDAFRGDTSPTVALATAYAIARSLERAGLINTSETNAGLRRVDALLDYVTRADSTAARAWTVRAIAARYRDPEQLSGAVAAHRRAVQLEPRSAEAAHEFGVTLAILGNWSEASAQFRRALVLDPGRPTTLVALASIEQRNGRSGLVCGLTNASIAADPFNPMAYGLRAIARLQLAQAREAYSDAETAARLVDSPYTRSIRLRVEVGSTNVDYAPDLARELVRRYLVGPGTLRVFDALELAGALVETGFEREAIGILNRARPVGRELRTGLTNKVFDPLRSEADFVRLVGSIPTRE
jgi:tetratricopeptide (TPR) repeat protein/TolB-like protein